MTESCTSNELKSAIEFLLELGLLSVLRNADSSEYVWLMMYLRNGGDEDWFGDASYMVVSVAESDLPNYKGIIGIFQGTSAWLKHSMFIDNSKYMINKLCPLISMLKVAQ